MYNCKAKDLLNTQSSHVSQVSTQFNILNDYKRRVLYYYIMF